MKSPKRFMFPLVGSSLASLALACATQPPPIAEEVHKLVELSRDSNAALMQGDIARYATLLTISDDFTLMSPFGGTPSRGPVTEERLQAMGKFFKHGSHEQELVHAYGSADMVVLAIIERARVEVGGLPAQDWALRVTLVYRRDGSTWSLVHRHADPLVGGINLQQAAALGRGEPLKGS
jgi:ketosteroid isomerase-like protein